MWIDVNSSPLQTVCMLKDLEKARHNIAAQINKSSTRVSTCEVMFLLRYVKILRVDCCYWLIIFSWISKRSKKNLRRKVCRGMLNRGVSLSVIISLSRTGKNYPLGGIVSGPRTQSIS